MAWTREKALEYGREYRKANKKKQQEYYKEYVDKNREKRQASNKAYKQRNPGKVNVRNAKRRALRMGASIANTDIDTLCIKILYSIAKSKEGDYHVDHIHPLSKGGSHHPMNLQIITAEENLKKGDRV